MFSPRVGRVCPLPGVSPITGAASHSLSGFLCSSLFQDLRNGSLSVQRRKGLSLSLVPVSPQCSAFYVSEHDWLSRQPSASPVLWEAAHGSLKSRWPAGFRPGQPWVRAPREASRPLCLSVPCRKPRAAPSSPRDAGPGVTALPAPSDTQTGTPSPERLAGGRPLTPSAPSGSASTPRSKLSILRSRLRPPPGPPV